MLLKGREGKKRLCGDRRLGGVGQIEERIYRASICNAMHYPSLPCFPGC